MLPLPFLSFVNLISIFTVVNGKFAHVIYVDNQHGSNTEECLLSNNESLACRDLDWVFKQPLTRRNSTQFVLAKGTHPINWTFPRFENLSQLEFRGKNASFISCAQTGIGLTFINIQDISFYNLRIWNCSSLCNSTSRKIPLEINSLKLSQFYVALYILRCQNVVMENVEIQETPNGTAVVMYNVVGLNVITNSVFGKNNFDNHPGGGAFIIEFTYCLPEDVSCFEDETDDHLQHFNSNGHYIFENVTFYNNSAGYSTFFSQDNNYYIPYKTMHSSFGKGGGLALMIKGNASHNEFIIRNCEFIHNEAVRGSGFVIEFQDLASNNTVVIEDCLFLDNGVADPQQLQTSGGGLMIGHYIYSDGDGIFNILKNILQVTNCNFINNRAFNGGGISIFPARIKTGNINNVFSLNIKNSHFTRNVAQLGAAIEVTLFSLFVDGELTTVHIEMSTFISNSIYFKSTFSINEDGIGSVYTNSVPIQFKGVTQFQDNKGSALAMVGAMVDFTDCNALFIGNSGRYGGGINILGSAFLLVNKNTTLTFINNLAHIHGGAISNTFTERENFHFYSNCFVRHIDPFSTPDNWNSKFIFVNNSAMSLGPSIYTTSVLPCTWAGGSEQQRLEDIFHWKGWSYYRNTTLQEVATSVGRIQYFSKIKDNEDHDHILTSKSIPGKKFKLPLQIQDDLHQSNVAGSTTFMVRLLNNTANVRSSHSFVTGNRKLQFWGHENSQVRVALDSIGERSWHVEFDLDLSECPPGYFIPENSSNHSCRCRSIDYWVPVLCSSNFQAYIKNGYWMGKPEKNKVEFSICPLSYCWNGKDGIYNTLRSQYSKLTEDICSANNREGHLCGQCKKNYGVSVTTENLVCIPCNDTQLTSNIVKYIFIVYFPLLILFSLLLIFQVRLSSGSANSFIFYAQTVSSTLGLPADGHIYVDAYLKNKPKLMKLIKIFYGIFNLRVAENMVKPLCIHTKLNALDVFQLSYLVALFPFLFILIIIVGVKINDSSITRRCCGICKWKVSWFRYLKKWNIGNSLLHVFAAYLLLSYTRLTLSSLFILHSSKQQKEHYNFSERVFYAGQYTISDPKYIWRYQFPACLVLLTTFLLPVALFRCPIFWLEKCINRIKWLSKWYPADKIHIFLDTFQGCYRDNRRYFAGMYFLFRIFMGASYLLARDWFHQYMIQQFVCVVIILSIGILRPYRKEFWYLNAIDLLMFTNLAIVNGLSTYMLSFNGIYNHNSVNFQYIFYTQIFFVYLPMIYMLVHIIWTLIPKSYKKYFKNIIHQLTLKAKKMNARFLYRAAIVTSALPGEHGIGDNLLTPTSSTNTCDTEISPASKYCDNPNISQSMIIDEFSHNQMETTIPHNEEGRASVNEICSLVKTSSSSVSKRPTYGLF